MFSVSGQKNIPFNFALENVYPQRGKVKKYGVKVKKYRAKSKGSRAKLKSAGSKSHCIKDAYLIDDGVSGTRFDRPGFLAMMEEVEAGRVEAIVIKDMSRLGRDYLKVGQVMEILRQRGVRLIAINDGVDSLWWLLSADTGGVADAVRQCAGNVDCVPGAGS